MSSRSALPAACGVLAAGLGTAAAHLVAALVSPPSSPVLAVGSQVIDATPTPVKEWAVGTFGTADKPILIGSVAVVALLLAAVAGAVRPRSRLVSTLLLLLLTGLAGAAAVLRPSADPLAWLPAVVAAVVGVLTLDLLVARVLPSGSAHADPSQPTRRRVVALGGTGAAALLIGGSGQALIGRSTPPTLTLPEPARPLPPLPKGVEVGTAGISPFVTPNADFYRIDTALLAPRVDPGEWSLTIDGDVPREVTLDIDELLATPMVERDITLNCVSNEVGGPYIGTARWLGVPTRELLARAGIDRDPRDPDLQVLSTSTDGMTISTPLSALLDGRDALVAVGMNGAPLPREHGFPARLVTPGLYGFVGATKWLTRMTVTRYDAASAYWTDRDWATDGRVRTQARIDTPRALRRIGPGRTVIGGVAWAQRRGISRVEVRIDDGDWQRATLGTEADVDCWRQWFLPWDATPGRHDLTVRATDGTGEVQTRQEATPFPAGATGWHSIAVTVTD
ncbi:molybdopterin-dependent oxidoreductase [Janibacter sp. CX7]|uniref:molybdopterin-dependent oxidoreductase n=1 Tax=Janibacter sp. CX7 TaxID=2963431 RepID=UPI0020CC678C|nr:molybdopterin-dependent oxidoreductase [Janibacter sp. CX7]UTT65381.1 molybdopterin-dependent oxidoreductase [Janibacter sp. CX7]